VSPLDSRTAVQERIAVLDEERAALVAILDAYERLEALTKPERASVPSVPAPAPAPVPLPPGDGSLAIILVECPQCGEKVKRQGLGPHSRKHKPRPATDRKPSLLEAPRTERNPRTTPPLDLPPRLDQAVGE
jgi:hypothetical protein